MDAPAKNISDLISALALAEERLQDMEDRGQDQSSRASTIRGQIRAMKTELKAAIDARNGGPK